MAKVKTIKVKLTGEQLKQMKPLFDQLGKHPNEGFIIGQIYQEGVMMVGFTTPEEVYAGMKQTIAKKILAKKTEDLLSSTAP